MSAIYNDNNPFVSGWIEELIERDQIPKGTVYRRSIRALSAIDVAGPGQRHFFAGIGGWARALRLAGVRDDANIWTGSCPCQPFSSAGRRKAFDDDRHLWPDWFRLISECRPPVIFGEQVANRVGLQWLDAVFADLENAGYTCAAANLPAAGVGAPHKRQRLFFMAHSSRARPDWRSRRPTVDGNSAGELGDAGRDRAWQHPRELHRDEAQHEVWATDGNHASFVAGAISDQWSSSDWIPCRDGVVRPVESGTFPLAHGIPARVELLAGYGNAIVPQLGAAFIAAGLDAIEDALAATPELPNRYPIAT